MVYVVRELNQLVDEYMRITGVLPEKIEVSNDALRHIISDHNESGEFQFSFNTQDGVVGTFFGIPIVVRHDVSDGVVDAIASPWINGSGKYRYGQRFEPRDFSLKFSIITGFDAEQLVDNENGAKDDTEEFISDEQFVELLNGGGCLAATQED